MPKVRDLGISFIPATMRPLEYGDGAPGAQPCEPSGCTKDSSCIEPSTGKDKDKDKDRDIADVEPCVPLSGICDKDTHCTEPSGGYDDDIKGDKKNKSEGQLNAAAIAQLKQQLQQQLGV